VAQALAGPTVLGAEEASVIVASYQGVVTLSGRVASDQKRMAVIEAAGKVTGVQTVIDNLSMAA
jgi:osmotically-inducible protein OsmY